MDKLYGLRGEVLHSGRYKAQILRRGVLDDEFEFDNICVTQGLVASLNIMFTGATQLPNWYLALFQNNYTPVASDTASSIVSNAGEFTGYSGGARPTFSPAQASGSATLTNAASQATFTFTGSATLVGAFLISTATPGSNTGTLFSAAQFPSPKVVGNTDQLLITYTLSASST